MGSKKSIYQYFSVPYGTLVYANGDEFTQLKEALLKQNQYRVYNGLDSIMIFHNDKLSHTMLDEFLSELIENTSKNEADKKDVQSIPIWYDLDSKDWLFIEEYLNITRNEIIKIHVESLHRIEMYGFLPGFAYIKNNYYSFNIPKKKLPDERLKAGSVALAGDYTGIYPVESPGGWQVIGRSPLKLFAPSTDTQVKFEVGTTVQFKAITLEAFKILNEYE